MSGLDKILIISLAKGIRGVTYKPGHLKQDVGTEDFFLLRSNNIQDGKVVFSNRQIVDKVCVSERQKLIKGDIIVCMSNGSRPLVGKSAQINALDGNYCVGSFCSSFRVNNGINPSFVFQVFRSKQFKHSIDIILSGSAINNLQNKHIEELEFNIPSSPAEQGRIAQILTKADQTIEQTEKLIAKYHRIKTGLMQDLLKKGIDEKGNIRSEKTHRFKTENGLNIPEEWSVKKFENYILKIDSGWSPNCESKPATIGEWGSLKTTAVTWDGYNSNENKKLPEELNPIHRIEVHLNDILITRVGPRERVGVVVHVDDTREKLMLSDNMLRLKIKTNDEIFLPLLPLILGSNTVQKVWKNQIAGLAEAQVVINQQAINSVYIPLPPPNEQREIFKKYQVIKTHLDKECLNLKKHQSLKIGLMQDLLSGKVRVKIKEYANSVE